MIRVACSAEFSVARRLAPVAAIAVVVLSLAVARLPGQAAGQGAGLVEELDAAARATHRIILQREVGDGEDRKVVLVKWGEIEVPLRSPVGECAVGLVTGGKELIVLAGGVRSSLDLYLVQSDGAFQHYATDGGRRLPRKFNHGAGSWPIVEGRHLLFFGFEKRTGIEFRALDFAGRVHLERRLPARVAGWTVASDPDGGEVRVEFGGGTKPSLIRHPLAPWLELSRWGLIQFGKVEVGSRSRQFLELTNRGKRPLKLRVELARTGFEITGEVPAQLAPGETHRMRIEFVPEHGGAFDVGLKFVATGVVSQHTVRLRGEGITSPRRGTDPGPAAKLPEGPIRVPVLSRAVLHPRGGGRVLVLGRVRTPSPRRVVLRTATGVEQVVVVDVEGRFHARCAATGGSSIRFCAMSDSGKRSAYTALGTVPRMLVVNGKAISIQCLPEESFTLTVRAEGEVLRRWRGKADAAGRCLVPLAIFGERKPTGPELTVEVAIRQDGIVRVSKRVSIDR